MTTARLLSAPAEGHGLISAITDKHYRALVEGREPGIVVAVVLLEPVGVSQRKTAKGLHRSVTYEAKRLEVAVDGHQVAELQYLVQSLYEQRTSNVAPRYLPVGFSGLMDEDKRQQTMEAMEDWAKEAGMTGGDLEAMWRDHFGIGEGEDWSYGDQGVPGDYRKASLNYLLEFGYAREILSRDSKLPHEERDEAEAGDSAQGPDAEPDAGATADGGDGAAEPPAEDAEGVEQAGRPPLASVPAFSG